MSRADLYTLLSKQVAALWSLTYGCLTGNAVRTMCLTSCIPATGSTLFFARFKYSVGVRQKFQEHCLRRGWVLSENIYIDFTNYSPKYIFQDMSVSLKKNQLFFLLYFKTLPRLTFCHTTNSHKKWTCLVTLNSVTKNQARTSPNLLRVLPERKPRRGVGLSQKMTVDDDLFFVTRVFVTE